MPANGLVKIILQATGASQVRRALRGVVSETRAADRATASSGRAAMASRTQASRASARDESRAARARVSASQAADRAILASIQRLSREVRRLRQSDVRDARRAMREQARAREEGGGGGRGGSRGGGVAAVAAGVGQALHGRVQGWQGALGAPSRDELIQRRQNAELSLIRMTTGAGMDVEQSAALQRRVVEVSRGTGADLTSLVDALGIAQNRFSNLQGFADQLDSIASASRAVGAPVGDMVGALGEFERQLGVSSEDIPTMLGVLADGMNQGSLEAGDVAAAFSPIMSDFASLRGEGGRGVTGATEFLAVAQALGNSGAGPEGARTLMQNMMSGLRRQSVQSGLERNLGDNEIFNDQGQLTIDLGELLRRMSASPNMQSAAVMEQIFGQDMQAAQARNTLLERLRNGDDLIGNLMNTSASRGTEFLQTTNRRIDASAAGESARIAANAEATFFDNSEDFIRTMNAAVGPFSELTAQYPLATEALGALTDVVQSVTGALGAASLAGFFGGAGAGGAAAGGAAVGGGAAAGGGALAVAGALGLGGAVGGAIAGTGYLMHRDLTAAREEGERREQGWQAVNTGRVPLTPEIVANLTNDSTYVDRAGRADARVRSERMGRDTVALMEGRQALPPPQAASEVTLSRDSADALGQAFARAFARGAPASGREPGEPGAR